MILNAYALIAGSVDLLRFLVALGLLLGGWCLWRTSRAQPPSAVEDRAYLLFLLAFFAAGLSLISWPLLYAVLHSYVPEWPGVMCIYGVTRVGTGSEGPSGWLPGLLQVAQSLKPAVIFLAGTWLVLHAIHRRSRTAWLLRPILVVLMVVGAASGVDAAVEIAYLAIPKQNEFLASGCCTVPREVALSAAAGPGLFAGWGAPWLTAMFYSANGGLLLLLRRSRRACDNRQRAIPITVLVGVAVAVTVTSVPFFTEVLVPRVLAPLAHHCVYDLFPRAPHVLLAAACFISGLFSIGWAAAAGRLGTSAESNESTGVVECLLRAAERGYLGALLLATGALAVSGW